MDGVVVDSIPFHYKAFQRLSKELGRPCTVEHLDGVNGMVNTDIMPLLFGVKDPVMVKELSDRKESYFREIFRDEARPMAGFLALVEDAKAHGMKIALGTSAPKENVNLVLDTLRLRTLFDAVVCDRDVKRGKPAPDIYLLCAKRLGIKPADCVVIEDALNGVHAAKAAGMYCIGLANPRFSASDLEEADKVVGGLSDISLHLLDSM
jgi:HAD superfamily hydrolase (TIGR01509 family)